MNKITVKATQGELVQVLNFIGKELGRHGIAPKARLQVMIAVEEIYINIVSYAYTVSVGEVECSFTKESDSITITFIDSGTPYNPLEKKNPDTTLASEDREIGGLGIYIVKKSMDKVLYEFKNDKNRLTIIKNIVNDF